MENLLMGLVATGVFTFILGVLVVFGGMLVIVTFVTLAGKIINSPSKKTQPVKEQPQVVEEVVEEEISTEVKLAIIAAISAYYMGETAKNEFKVKQIKRI